MAPPPEPACAREFVPCGNWRRQNSSSPFRLLRPKRASASPAKWRKLFAPPRRKTSVPLDSFMMNSEKFPMPRSPVSLPARMPRRWLVRPSLNEVAKSGGDFASPNGLRKPMEVGHKVGNFRVAKPLLPRRHSGGAAHRFAAVADDFFPVFVALAAASQVGWRRIVKLRRAAFAISFQAMAKHAVRLENHFAATHRIAKHR